MLPHAIGVLFSFIYIEYVDGNFRQFSIFDDDCIFVEFPVVTGIIWGFMTGLVTRFTENVRVIEPVFIFVMAYLAYLNAEMLHLSGIMS